MNKVPAAPGQFFAFEKYLARTSDLLSHLLLEHQAGFVNRCVEAGYRARTARFLSPVALSSEQEAELNEQAERLTRYLLFAEEQPLPPSAIQTNTLFQAEFMKGRRTGSGQLALKDLDLLTRLFRHRCSYMIYSPVFDGLPRDFKQRVYSRIQKALSAQEPDPAYAYLPQEERTAIRGILKATLTDLPASW